MEEVNLKYRTNVDMPKDIRFGVEIEFSNAKYRLVKNELEKNQDNGNLLRYKLDTDQTVSETTIKGVQGGEIKTPILTNNSITWKELKEICLILKKLEGSANRNCGCHIHYDRNLIANKNKDLFNFLKLWTVFEDIIFRFSCGESSLLRNNISLFSKEIGRDIYGLVNASNNYSVDEICNIVISNYNEKKHAINFSKNYDTLEIRVPKGTINQSIIQNYVLFFSKIFLYVLSDKYDSDLIDFYFKNYDNSKMVLETYKDIDIKRAELFSDLIYNKKEDKNLFLKQYLKSF